MHNLRTANLLGATALAVTDLALAGVTEAGGLSASGAAALVVLSDPASDLSVTELGRRVGLTQSAAARMVASLEAEQLVTRQAGAGRVVNVELTPAGRDMARDSLAARAEPLCEALDVLDADERESLAALLGKILVRLHGEVGDAELMCRLCDRRRCTDGAACPVGQAAREQEP